MLSFDVAPFLRITIFNINVLLLSLTIMYTYMCLFVNADMRVRLRIFILE